MQDHPKFGFYSKLFCSTSSSSSSLKNEGNQTLLKRSHSVIDIKEAEEISSLKNKSLQKSRSLIVSTKENSKKKNLKTKPTPLKKSQSTPVIAIKKENPKKKVKENDDSIPCKFTSDELKTCMDSARYSRTSEIYPQKFHLIRNCARMGTTIRAKITGTTQSHYRAKITFQSCQEQKKNPL